MSQGSEKANLLLKIAALFFIFTLSSCGVITNDILPISSSACSKLKSEADGTKRSLEITFPNGDVYKVLATMRDSAKYIRSFPNRQHAEKRMTFVYRFRCRLSVLRDVRSIEPYAYRDERMEQQHKVTLRNGRVIHLRTEKVPNRNRWRSPYNDKPGTYDNRVTSPYFGVYGNWPSYTYLVQDKHGHVSYKKFNTYHDNLSYSVLDKPVDTDAIDSYFARREEEVNQRNVELSELNASLHKARLERRVLFAKQENVGRRICKTGLLKYSVDTGQILLGQPHYRDATEDGEIIAALENSSQDGRRIKVLIEGWTNSRSKLSHTPTSHPRLDGISTRPGLVSWVDSDGWFFCD